MSTSSSRKQSETSESVVVPTSTSIPEFNDRPLLLKISDETSPMITHFDENNENDAVRSFSLFFFLMIYIILMIGIEFCFHISLK